MYRLDDFIAEIERKNPSEPEFIQAVREVTASVIDTVNDNPMYIKNRILERITEPDRWSASQSLTVSSLSRSNGKMTMGTSMLTGDTGYSSAVLSGHIRED